MLTSSSVCLVLVLSGSILELSAQQIHTQLTPDTDLRALLSVTKQESSDAAQLAYQQFQQLHPSTPPPHLDTGGTLFGVVMGIDIDALGDTATRKKVVDTSKKNAPDLSSKTEAPLRLPILGVDGKLLANYQPEISPKRLLSEPTRVFCPIYSGANAVGATILFKSGGKWTTEAFGTESLTNRLLENFHWDLLSHPANEVYFVLYLSFVDTYILARYEGSQLVGIFGGAPYPPTIQVRADREPLTQLFADLKIAAAQSSPKSLPLQSPPSINSKK